MPLQESEQPGRLQYELLSRGVSVTHQRHTILSIVEATNRPWDVDEIVREAQKLHRQINRATVYRAIKLLKGYGLVEELEFKGMHGEKHYYELRPQRDRVQMTCLRCSKIAEIETDLFEGTKEQFQQHFQFRIVASRFEFGGYCAICRAFGKRAAEL